MSSRLQEGLEAGATSSRRWLGVLVATQLLVCVIVFWRFLFGERFFAYLDIGSDSFKAYVPYLVLWSNYLREVGLSGWSFQIGLGGQVVPFLDPFSWLPSLAGAEHVLGLRVWVMIARMVVAGWAVYGVLRRLSVGAPSAAIGALMYTFCGYAQVDAQWDHMANELVLYPVLLLSILHRLGGGHPLALVAAVAAGAISNVFFVSMTVFAGLTFLAMILCSEDPRKVVGEWCLRIVPPYVVGMGLAGPVLLPYLHQLLDSPRVTGTQALFSQRLGELFSVNDWPLVLVQISGLFGKNLLGIGSNYVGWGNYLEGPGFYIGAPGLLLIPQLWQAGGRLRRAFIFALCCITLYFVFPAFRYAAFGFAIQYFRVSTLWITLLLLLLSILALDTVLRLGVNRKLLACSAIFCIAVPTLLRYVLPISPSAYLAWIVFTALGVVLLLASSFAGAARSRLVGMLVVLVAAESAWTAYSSVNSGRLAVTAGMSGYNDAAKLAVQKIREIDPGFYRLEKGFVSVSDNDALVQGYHGVQSYAFHGRSVVRLHTALGTIPAAGRGVNYTNWLPDFGARFPLYSWVGVKYFLSRYPISWPGFVEIGRAGEVIAYRNELAYPLGVVYHQQVSEQLLENVSPQDRDRVLLHALVTSQSLPGLSSVSSSQLFNEVTADFDVAMARYVARARTVQAEGLALSHFDQNHIAGRVTVDRPSALAFSIPFNDGWHARVDGDVVPLVPANYGFFALPLAPGAHVVELEFRTPWLGAGWGLAAFSGVLLLLIFMRGGRLMRARCGRQRALPGA